MLAASRDEGYWIRERVFGALTGAGIDLYLVENPFYGLRRDGRGPSDITVSDHGLMALAMVLEARALLDYLRSRYPKLAVAGYSMGGHMAAITAAVTPMPVACAALATGASASAIYTRGLLSWSVDFEALGEAMDGMQRRASTAEVVRHGRHDGVSSADQGRCGGGVRMHARRVRAAERNREIASPLEGEFAALDQCGTFFRTANATARAVRLRGRGGGEVVKAESLRLRPTLRCQPR